VTEPPHDDDLGANITAETQGEVHWRLISRTRMFFHMGCCLRA
jgi:hypothetical protein